MVHPLFICTYIIRGCENIAVFDAAYLIIAHSTDFIHFYIYFY